MTKNITPDFYAIRIDVTDNYDQDFLTKLKIKSVSSIYVFDKNEVTHLCEFAPSYCLYFLEDIVWEMQDGHTEDEWDEARDEVMLASQGSDNVSYYHCSDIDSIPESRDKLIHLGEFGDIEEYHAIEDEDDRDYYYNERIVEEALEYCRCNAQF